MTASCPWCAAPRDGGTACARCGAIYAKAEALRAGAAIPRRPGPAVTTGPAPAPPRPIDAADARALRLEVRLQLLAVPAALAAAALLAGSGAGRFFVRTFLGMMVHEVGHAVASWLCGFFALPLLWVTFTSASRSAGVALALAAAGAWAVVRGVRARRRAVVAAGAGLLLAQVVGTLLLDARSAQALITFAGDGGAMVLGSALMAAFALPPGGPLHRGGLRWGLLVIGAGAFVDAFATWWSARANADAIPFGVSELAGLSDPSKLVDVYGWTPHALVQRYLALGAACLAALACAWIAGVRRARRATRPSTGARSSCR